MTEEEFNNFMYEIRFTRDSLLSKTDWTQLADSPVDKIAWSEYRQALRDFPELFYFGMEEPYGIPFPLDPNGNRWH